jgi:diguanylate cyclase (GGDEF)-like protein
MRLAQDQLLWGAPVLAVTLALIGIIEWFGVSALNAPSPLPFVTAVCALATYALASRLLSPMAAGFAFAATMVCVLGPFIWFVAIEASAFNQVIASVLAVTLTGLSLSWRSILLAVLVLTVLDVTVMRLWMGIPPSSPELALLNTATMAMGGSLLAVRISTVNRQADLVHWVQTQSRTDPLTGVLNRLGVAHGVQDLRKRPSAGAVAMVATYIDVDGLKGANDSLGHEYGDAVICDVADAIAAGSSSGDVVGRVGGDEFVIIGWDSLESRDNKCTRILTQLMIGRAGKDGWVPSLSFGSAILHAEDADLAAALQRADADLYHRRRVDRGSRDQGTFGD